MRPALFLLDVNGQAWVFSSTMKPWAAQHREKESALNTSSEPTTILYIEDDPASQKLVERTLKHEGFKVIIADCGLEGIDAARKHQPDLILVDINLPDLSGREVCTILRCDERFRSTPMVALTAQGHEQRNTSLASGINGYLEKPLDILELPQRINHYLQGGQDAIDESSRAEAQLQYTREVVMRLEERLRELDSMNKELSHLDQMKDTFIQLTAHELRTPLTLVYGYSRLLADHPPLKKLTEVDESIRGLVKGLSEAIERMHTIINELLIMSRIMTNQVDLATGPMNLSKLVAATIANYQHVLETRRLTINFDPAEWPQNMRADSELLKLVFSNLLSNAVKYTPDGGTITLKAETRGDWLHLRVQDTGIGINPEDQQRIFERFHTTRDLSMHSTSKTAFGGGGLGLGLPICKGIIEGHGGRIWVESERHDPELFPGSIFIVELPVITSGKITSTVIKSLMQRES